MVLDETVQLELGHYMVVTSEQVLRRAPRECAGRNDCCAVSNLTVEQPRADLQPGHKCSRHPGMVDHDRLC